MGAVALAALFIVSGAGLIFSSPLDQACNRKDASCGILIEVSVTGLIFALAVTFFFFWRVGRVTRNYLKAAEEEPEHLVPTATRIGKVVGREDLCEIIETDLCSREDRRPHVIVGAAGTGKTAVLVRLTQVLAGHGAVPVPVRLPDVQDGELSFRELAKERFLSRIDPWVLTQDEADKIWRRLYEQRRVVVLADGLDEALLEAGARNLAIKLAVHSARGDRLPLVIASRPDEALKDLDAAVVELEPLSANDAVDYLGEDEIRHVADPDVNVIADGRKLARFVVTAGVVEMPLYLQIARELNRLGELGGVDIDGERLALRTRLLQTWIDCRTAREIELPEPETNRAMEGLERLACLALSANQPEVGFSDFERWPYPDDDWDLDRVARLSARVGTDLELAERVRGGIRFSDSLIQAYLGAGPMPSMASPPAPRHPHAHETGEDASRSTSRVRELARRWAVGEPIRGGGAPRDEKPQPAEDRDPLGRALEEPGRELLMSLVICCQRTEDPGVRQELRERVIRAAGQQSGAEAFDLIAAAYEIERMLATESARELDEITREVWSQTHHGGPSVSVAKLRAASRIAEASTEEAYRTLWYAAQNEDSYRVRLHAAQRFASGGNRALAALDQAALDGTRVGQRLDASDATPGDVRTASLAAWTLPLLVSTCDGEYRQRALGALQTWIQGAEHAPHLGVQAALAQGFKWEANRRLGYGADTAYRDELIPLLLRLHRAPSWWYAQVSSLQTLALWSLPDDVDKGTKRELRAPIDEARRARDEHPFVRETARLCQRALGTHRLPRGRESVSRYLWIDEVGVAARIGTSSAATRTYPIQPLWITAAVGWRALDERAQQLVADILILLNLVERGVREDSVVAASPDLLREREERRRRSARHRRDLPRCIARVDAKSRLEVEAHRPAGVEAGIACDHDCPFDLCPYPPPGVDLFRGELRETFCREQRRIVRGSRLTRQRGRLPPWQETAPRWRPLLRRKQRKRLAEFWTAMERRTRPL